MNCNKCSEYKWPDWQRNRAKELTERYAKEFTDESGNDLCIFHAPCEQKDRVVKGFNNAVFALIRSAMRKGTDADKKCHLNATVFPANINFGERLKKEGPLPDISFNYAQFHGEALFNDIRFGGKVDFYTTHFHKVADFSKVKFDGDASFSQTKLDGESVFTEARFHGLTIFSGCKFNGIASFRKIPIIENMLFSDIKEVSIKNAEFLKSPLENISFLDVKWQRDGNEQARYKIPQEDEVKKLIAKDRKEKLLTKDEKEKLLAELLAIAEFYRQMKRKSKAAHNEADTSLWHQAEREAQLEYLRAGKSMSFIRTFLVLYRFFSGYGESPFRALYLLFVFIMVPFIILIVNVLKSSDASINYEVFKGIVEQWMYYLPLTEAKENATEQETFLRIISQLLITIQSALFGFALRNKFRR